MGSSQEQTRPGETRDGLRCQGGESGGPIEGQDDRHAACCESGNCEAYRHRKPAPLSAPEPVKTDGLFDAPETVAVTALDNDDEEEIFREAADEDEAIDEGELDDAA